MHRKADQTEEKEGETDLMAIIKCCMDCVAPKRYPGCHDRCPEYLKEKAEYERLKAKADKIRRVDFSLYTQRSKAVRKALRHKR